MTLEAHAGERGERDSLAASALVAELLGDDSIHGRLSRRLASGVPGALAPCPEVDRDLGRLVAIIQGDYAPHACGLGLDQERALRAELLTRILCRSELRERARRLRAIAGLAEHALERHFSDRLASRLAEHTAAGRLPPAGVPRARALEARFAAFPYTRNYRQLILAELALLDRATPALVLRPPALDALPGSLRRAAERARERLQERARASHLPPWPERTLAVYGCGPLPLSGLFLHALTGARVLLLDNDPGALRAAHHCVRELERLRVLAPGAVQAHADDAGRLAVLEQTRVHVVLVASLVDAPARRALASRLHAGPRDSTLILMRSARELCAELAYAAVETHAVSHPNLPFCAEAVPEHLAQAAGPGVRVCAPRAVLNSSELYLSLELDAAERRLCQPLMAALTHTRDRSDGP